MDYQVVSVFRLEHLLLLLVGIGRRQEDFVRSHICELCI